MQKRVAVMGAWAVALALFVGGRAEASYNYATTLSITGVTGPNTPVVSNGGLTATFTGNGGSVTITFAPESRTGLAVPSANSLNIGDLTVSVAPGTTATSFNVTVLDTIGITNVPLPGGAGSGNLTLTDTILLSNISNSTGAGGGLNGTVTDTGPVVGTGAAAIGGVIFTVGPAFGFSSPTLNSSGGNLSATVTAGVPAPASLVMFGLGVGALGAIRLRRRFFSA